MAITNKDELDKKLTEVDGEVAALKAKAEENAKLHDEMEKVKADAKEMREKLAEVMSKNWVEKYSTQNTKEETLYKFGKYIKALRQGNVEDLNKFGQGGYRIFPNELDGDYKAQKTGTPLYSDAITGSYLIPVEYAAEVMYVAKQSSQMMGQVREIPMSGITKYVPNQGDAAGVTWLTLQSTARSETNPTFGQATLTAKTGAMYTVLVEELEEDSLVNIAAYYRDIFGEAFGYEFDKQASRGAATAAPFVGILNAATNNLVLGAGQTSFLDVKFDDLYDTISKLTAENYRVGAKWIMHCTVFDILRKVKDAQGQYLYQQPNGTQPGTLCGYPIISTDGMVPVADNAVSTKFIAFGNPNKFLWGNRLGVEFKVFPETLERVTQGSIFFRGRVRWAFTAGIPGAFVSVATAAS